jgi:hypothetical protein
VFWKNKKYKQDSKNYNKKKTIPRDPPTMGSITAQSLAQD